MLEIQLQQLWNDRRLPFHLFQLTDSRDIEIIQLGTWNTSGSGPDFQFAKVRFDKLTWCGSIEFHLKASDWYKHQHQDDASYHNVILHVVYENDQPVYLHDSLIPTIELKTYLEGEFKFPRQYQWIKSNEIACKKRLNGLQDEFQHMQHRSLEERLIRKYLACFDQETNVFDFYHLISKAFGTKTNSLSFELLAQQIPLLDHLRTSPEHILKDALSNNQGWKGKNLILTGHLKKRVQSWTKFIRWFLEVKEQNVARIPWDIGFLRAEINSKMLQNNLLINVKTYLIMEDQRKVKKQSTGVLEAMKFLKSLPSEKNGISNIWKSVEIEAKNALETQANLEIYQQFCANNKCLDCCVGQQLLKS